MEIILIFTSQRATKNGLKLPWALAEIQVQPISITPEKRFLIAYDEITDPGIITTALQNIPVTMLYVMHHSKPKKEILLNLRAALDALRIPYEYPFFQSEHLDLDNYIKVPSIEGLIKNGHFEQLELLFDDFKKQLTDDSVLEIKLNILHFLLTTDTLTTTDKKKLDEYIVQAGDNEDITAAIADFTTTSNSHFDRLTALRDQLLSEY